MVRKYQAIDIANYILWYANEHYSGTRVTALKLHKLLYYVAAKYYYEREEFLFDEKIEKWQYGPVTPSVYHAFKGRGYSHLPGPAPEFEITSSGVSLKTFVADDVMDKEDRELFDKVIDLLIDKTAAQLVEMTHEEPAWSDNEKEIYQGKRNLEYTGLELKESIQIHGLS